MALSQIQCLDDNHVNLRIHEAKPEFLYCEDQRVALETLLQDGREEFVKYLEARGLRGFLSDPELETLAGAAEPYDPGAELFPGSVEDDPTPLSLHYWPDLSDTSIPQMDLGWPDSDSYRGVTRTTVHTQPPLEGQTHIKEVVRKMIAQAQKVIAVVMDVFTDVDIFRDLLDAGFKRKVSIYILLERTTLPHFLSMCQRANMHTGHLKHLRVRCTEGAEFYSRSCTRVRGRMGHRFMFIDGDKAVSGSYGFTWMSSRLDRNLITVVTGQAVDGFDRVFRFLYASSGSVDLRQVTMEPEPEPDPLPQTAAVVPPSAAVARKLFNPKYALVAASNPSPTTSVGRESPKEPQTLENGKKRRRMRASEDAVQGAPPLHPGLMNLEKASLIAYLPTWPEPDPPSDVIGFINIRDANRPTRVHLQRSEMFETSQAIRFSSPFGKTKEVLPEVAKPRQLTVKREEINKPQPVANIAKAKEVEVDKALPAYLGVVPGDIKRKEEASEQKSPAYVQKSEPDKDTTKVLNTENKLYSNTATKLDAGHDKPFLSALPQSSSKLRIPNKGTASQTVSTNSPKSDALPEPNTKKEAETVTSFNTQCVTVYRTYALETNSKQTSQLRGPTDFNSNTEHETQKRTVPSHTDSHPRAVNKQPSEITPNIQTPIVHSHISTSSAPAMQSVSSTCLSENNHIAITTAHSSTATSACAAVPSASSSSSLLPLTSSFTALNPPLPSSSASPALTSALPIPRPRTVQLVIKGSSSTTSSSQKPPDICVVKKPETGAGPLAVRNEPSVATVQTSPVKEPETDRASKPGEQKDAENTGNPKETTWHKQSTTSQETKAKEAVGRRDAATGNKLQTRSEVLITDTLKAASANVQEIIPKDAHPKTLISTDCKITPKAPTDDVTTVQTNTKAPQTTPTGSEFAKVLNEKGENVTQFKTYLARAHEPQRISYYRLTPQDIGVFEAVDSLKAPIHTPFSTSHIPYTSKDSSGDGTLASAADTHGQQGRRARFTPAQCADSVPNTAKHNTHGTFQEQLPKARGHAHTLRLQLSETHAPELRSPTPERESWSLKPLARTPTPERFPTRTPTPDSQTPSPDPRSHTPDIRTPASDISDGYVSPRDDSNLSTTSEEYYECSDSPFHDPVFEHMVYHNHGTTEDHVGFTHANTSNATTAGTSPAYINYSPGAATLSTADRNTSWSETQTLSGPASVSSSSFLGKKSNTREAEDAANEGNGREEDERGWKLSVVERRAERESQRSERRDSEEAGRIMDHFKQDEDSTEKGIEALAAKRKKALNQFAASRLVDGGVTAGGWTNEGTQPKRSSAGDLKPEGERADKVATGREKALNRVALRPSGVERRERPQSSGEIEGQKFFYTPLRTLRVQQQDSRPSSPSQPPKPPRPLSGSQHFSARPWGSRQLNQTESKVLHSSLHALDKTASPRRPPSRPPPPAAGGSAGAAAGRKQASQSQQSLLPRQPPAAQSRTRAGQTANQTSNPKPQASFLYTQSNLQPQPYPHPQNQMVSAQEVHGQEEGSAPLGFTFSRLYNLKGLKEKMSKLPAQSRRGSASPPVQGHKSTS